MKTYYCIEIEMFNKYIFGLEQGHCLVYIPHNTLSNYTTYDVLKVTSKCTEDLSQWKGMIILED